MSCLRLLSVLVLMLSCTQKREDLEQDPQQLVGDVSPTEVQTVLARSTPFEYLVNTTGKIQARIDVEIKSQIGGVVEKLLIDNGAHVKAGQTLICLTNTQQVLAQDKARLQMQEREIAYQDALFGYSKPDSTEGAEARRNIRITSGLAAAEISFKEAQLAWEQTFIKAPTSGTISNLEVSEGSFLSANQTVCRIHSTGELLVFTELLETDALLVQPRMNAEIKILGSDTRFTAKVSQINPRVDEKSKMVKVSLRIAETARLLPGMTAQITIKVPHEKVIAVPREAVVIRSGRQVVFTAQNGLAKWNYVTVGRENGKDVEIMSGLTEGQHVIITNNLQLAHDAVVKTSSGLN